MSPAAALPIYGQPRLAPPLLGALLDGGLPMLSIMEVEALWKEQEDTIKDAKDARREVKEEQLIVSMTKNM